MWDNDDQERFVALINENYKWASPMKHISLVLFALIINACASSNTAVTADGKVEHHVYCSGFMYSWDDCYEKASEICGAKAYDVLQKYEDEGAFVAYENAQELPDRRLIIRCKE
jgi:hypothetical protein